MPKPLVFERLSIITARDKKDLYFCIHKNFKESEAISY